MSGAIGPGDYVECVDASPHRKAETDCRLVLGSIYRVERVFSHGEIWGAGWHDEGAIRLMDDPAPPGLSWDGRRFRPIYRPTSSLIEALKQPAPDAVRQLEDA